ncbi:hypothetical protein ABIB83_005461 [Bradyrhizobium sp. I1.8.5]|uniref:hypothetical protein n=1 Tax=Bradyrhizobium sp. I1.8.5 TaxID=3156365 RepID=UPI003395C028
MTDDRDRVRARMTSEARDRDLSLVQNLRRYCSAHEQKVIDLLFAKLMRGDRVGFENSLRSRTAAALRRRGVITVERQQ